LVEPYLTPGATYSTWVIDRNGDAPLTVDFGDEAPWSEDDLRGPWDNNKEAAA
jgi:hypothetical protein